MPPGGSTIQPDTVAALLVHVRDLARAEETRGQSFNQRAGWLLGFGGVILTLTATQASELLGGGELGCVAQVASSALLALAILLITVAAGFAIWIMMPRDLWHISIQAIQQYPTVGSVSQPVEQAEGSAMVGLINQLAAERGANNLKAKRIRRGSVLLMIGLVALAAQVGIFVIEVA